MCKEEVKEARPYKHGETEGALAPSSVPAPLKSCNIYPSGMLDFPSAPAFSQEFYAHAPESPSASHATSLHAYSPLYQPNVN
ncbi:hypothetical protein Pmani_012939 [Petrolisthes manimaculis]|uniref:Uncharacterized protein n=1 Tax=Petrolisthes manimaculis TaxID=1843537 RepID=A0AAE1PYE6_9EUCA|nr:hypothetical protein Pmani_012939 [Petrolisthes manimaculis]